MAVRQLGVNMVINGAQRFASDLGHVALALYNYAKAVTQAQRTSFTVQTSAVNKLQSQLNSLLRTQTNLNKAFSELGTRGTDLRQQISDLQAWAAEANATRNIIAQLKLQQTELRAVIDASEASYIKLTKAHIALRDAGQAGTAEFKKQEVELQASGAELIKLNVQYDSLKARLAEYRKALTDQIGSTDKAAAAEAQLEVVEQRRAALQDAINKGQTDIKQKQDEYAAATAKLGQIMAQNNGFFGTMRSFLSALTGGFGQTIVASNAFSASLLKWGVMMSAIGVALDVVKLSIDALVTAFRLFMGAVQLVINVFKTLFDIAGKIAGVLISVGRSIIQFGANLVAIPFRVVGAGLTTIWQSLQRIGEIAIGMNLSNLIWSLGTRLKDLATSAFNAAADFQLLQVRMIGLQQRELSQTAGIPFSKSLDQATASAKELTNWISQLAVKSPFSAQTIADTLTLATSYDFTTQMAKDLTTATANFATGMGLTDTEMRRIIENFGQMVTQGQLTGTELRDLARGAFFPINEVLKQMADNLGKPTSKMGDLKKAMQDVVKGDPAKLNDFFKAFIQVVGKDFPNAMDRASTTWKTATSNMSDFIQTVIGWRVIKPALDEASKSLSDFVSTLMSPGVLAAADTLGQVLQTIVATLQEIVKYANPIHIDISVTSNILSQIGQGFLGGLLPDPQQVANDAQRSAEGAATALDNAMAKAVQSQRLAKTRQFIAGRGVAQIYEEFAKPSPAADIALARAADTMFFGFVRLGIPPGTADKLATLGTDMIKIIGRAGREPIGDTISSLWTTLSTTMGVLWTDIVQPEVARVWSKIVAKAEDVWNKTIKPFLVTLFNNVKAWLVDMWNNKLPAWWNEVAAPAIAAMLSKIVDWVAQNTTFAKSVGDSIGSALTGGVQGLSGSSIPGQIGSILGDILKIGVAQALDIASAALKTGIAGLFGGAGAAPAQPSPFQAVPVLNPQPQGPGTKAIPAAAQDYTTLKDAIDALNKSADTALRGALGNLGSTLQNAIDPAGKLRDNLTGLAGAATAVWNAISPFAGAFNNLAGTLNILVFQTGLWKDILRVAGVIIGATILPLLLPFVGAMTGLHSVLSAINPLWAQFNDALSKVVDLLVGGHLDTVLQNIGKNFKSTTDQIQVSKPMQDFLNWVQFLGDFLKNIKIPDALGGVATFFNTIFGGGAGGPASPTAGLDLAKIFGNIDLSGLGKKISDAFQGARDAVNGIVNGLSKDVQTVFTGLDVALVSASIIPDMLAKIEAAFINSWQAIVQDTYVQLVYPLEQALFVNMADEGVFIMSTLIGGMESMLGSFYALVSNIAAALHFNATVTVTTYNTTVDTGTTGTGKIANPGGIKSPFAKGGNFIVPPGFPNDSFIMGVTSGEQVIVIPKPSVLAGMFGVRNQNFSTMQIVNQGNTTITNTRQNTYQMNVTTQQPVADLTQQFHVLRLITE